MPRPTTPALLATALLVLGSTAAAAVDQPIPGKKLLVKVVKGRETLKFVARGRFTIPAPASADNPIVSGATVLLTNPSSGESFTFDLPAAHWTLNARKTAYRYRDQALVEPDRVTAALIKTTVIKMAARRTGITLDESAQGALAVALTTGSLRCCARFDDGWITKDQAGRFAAKNAPAPASCPLSATTTTGAPTTTLTTTTLTTTTTGTTATTTSSTTTSSTTSTVSLPPTTTTTTTTTTTSSTTSTISLPTTTSTTSTSTSTTSSSTTTTTTSSTTTTTATPTCGISPICGGACPLGKSCVAGPALSPCLCL